MTKTAVDLELLQSIICDDVRQEKNGKFILVGVYLDSIIMDQLPAVIPLCIWMQFSMHLLNQIVLEFEIKGSALKDPIQYSMSIDGKGIKGKSNMLPVVSKIAFPLVGEGSIDLCYRKKGDKKFKHFKCVEVTRNASKMN